MAFLSVKAGWKISESNRDFRNSTKGFQMYVDFKDVIFFLEPVEIAALKSVRTFFSLGNRKQMVEITALLSVKIFF